MSSTCDNTVTAPVENQSPTSILLNPGDQWVCKFVNAPNPASIKVVKTVLGGSDTFNFNLTGNGGGPSGGLGNGGTFTWAPLAPDADYTLSETDANSGGYNLLARDCVLDQGSPAGGTVTPNGNGNGVTIHPAAGQAYTCTYTNTKQSLIKVIKLVDDKQTADWTVGASALTPPANISPTSVKTQEATTSDFTLDHLGAGGATTTLTETQQPGYTAGDVSCSSSNQQTQPGTVGSVNVSVLPGQIWTCTFNNTTNAASVKVVKLVGGQPAEGWRFGATAVTPATVVAPASAQTDVQGAHTFGLRTVADGGSSVTVTETLKDGYAYVDTACVKQGGVPVAVNQGLAGTLIVHAGDQVVCTFDNTVNEAKVTVRKTVDGGDPVAGWTFGRVDDVAGGAGCAAGHDGGREPGWVHVQPVDGVERGFFDDADRAAARRLLVRRRDLPRWRRARGHAEAGSWRHRQGP